MEPSRELTYSSHGRYGLRSDYNLGFQKDIIACVHTARLHLTDFVFSDRKISAFKYKAAGGGLKRKEDNKYNRLTI